MSDVVLRLGDPRLRLVCEPVRDLADPCFHEENARLQAALEAFRAEHGFGRGIAAPQIGIAKRFIAINLGQGTHSLINPVITWRSPESFTLWDDCMCFPELRVKVHHHQSISLRFSDERGEQQHWEQLGRAESELLQHEVDHLDGVLAIDLAVDARSIVARSVFDADPEYFRDQVDYGDRTPRII
jgi:peptide deformylase